MARLVQQAETLLTLWSSYAEVSLKSLYKKNFGAKCALKKNNDDEKLDCRLK